MLAEPSRALTIAAVLLVAVTVGANGAAVRGQTTSAPADPVRAAIARGDFERATLLARLERSPERRCEVLLSQASRRATQDSAEARAVLQAVLNLVDRYRDIPEVSQRLAAFARRAKRGLAGMDLAGAQTAEDTVAAAEALLPLLPEDERGQTALETAIRLDDLGRRDLARESHRRAAALDETSPGGRAAAFAYKLLDGGSAAATTELETLISDLAEAGHPQIAGYVLALSAERAWQAGDAQAAAAMRKLLDRHAGRLTGADNAASRHRPAAHRVALARRSGDDVGAAAYSDLEAAHAWFVSRGMTRNAADAALVAASLARPGSERTRWLDEAAEAYRTLDAVDAQASETGLSRVAALRPPQSDVLASQFENGQARPDPMIEDSTGFYIRVRGAYEVRVATAFDAGAFDDAFRFAQQAKLVELGPDRPRFETLGYAAAEEPYLLYPASRQGPTVDLLAEYLVGESATYVFALRADEKRQKFERLHTVVPVGRDAFRKQVLDFLAAVDTGAPREGREMAETLLRGVWGKWDNPWIVLSPDGPLRFLPFALLPVPGAAEGETLLHRITAGRAAVDDHLRKRSLLLQQRQVDRAQREGLWPEVNGHVSYLPTVAVLGNESLANRETALSLWAQCAGRLRRAAGSGHPVAGRISASSPVALNITARGLVLSLWNEAGRSALQSPAGQYMRNVFSLTSLDFGVNNTQGDVVTQLGRDLSEGYRVLKSGRSADTVDLKTTVPSRDWARWIYVDLAAVRRPG